MLEQLAQGFAVFEKAASLQYQYNARDLVYQHNKIKLYHYQPKAKKLNATPVLVVFATVNRPEILDLFPDRSFIHGLLKNGMDVYLLDWGYPDKSDVNIRIQDYVELYLHQCIAFIQQASQQAKINLLGICQGGVFCLCYAALFSAIKNLVLISTPIDFHTRDNTVAHILKKIDFDTLVGSSGNISGDWLTQFFISLKPFELLGKKYLRFMDHATDSVWSEKFLRVEKWLYDAPDQTSASFRDFIEQFYQQNKLIKGEIYLNDKQVDLKNVTIPILNIMARDDHIIPMSASKKLKQFVATSHFTQKSYPSGHIGIYISDKVGISMSKTIASWLKKQSR